MTNNDRFSVSIEKEMREAYLDYAMSVIVARALPDARDGLKPVHRRILYAIHSMGLRPDSPHKKSARIVGEVLGKYHPHGDAAIYEAMVRLAQDFSLRYVLVDGQGNFGSIDGDAAAAMRYTEARMTQIGQEMLSQIEKDTVDFTENFDGSLLEPTVLPSSLPNLLVNGSSGIAVGMSTNIPPHNLGEICDALVYMLSHWNRYDEISIEELMQFIQGPDFPTGGVIYSHREDAEEENQIIQAYATGRGKITVRAKVHIEDMGRGKSRIIVSELPYQTNKSALIERIATLVTSGKLEGISDLRDESDRQNPVRLVIELQRGVDIPQVLDDLFKHTPLQETFSIIMLAIVDQQPRMLTLKQALRVYLLHRIEVVERRTRYDLARARERAHILEGLLKALDALDEVIQLIRRSQSADTAKEKLIRLLDITEIQAQAILDMQLRRLAALERKKILEEYKEKVQLIKYLESLLADPRKIRIVIAEELAIIKAQYGDRRRTVIASRSAGKVSDGDLFVPEEPTWISLTLDHRIARSHSAEPPKVTATMKSGPRFIAKSTTAANLYLITQSGECASLPVHQLPQTAEMTEGAYYWDLCPLKEGEDIAALISLPMQANTGYLFLVTADAQVKRIRIEDLPGLSAKSFSVMNVSKDDRIVSVLVTSGNDEVILASSQAQAIRFSEQEVRPTGLPAGGMKGMKLLNAHDRVVGAVLVRPKSHVWSISDDGIAKTSLVEEYPLQGRGGSGVINMRLASSSRAVAAIALGNPDDNIIVITTKKKPLYMRIGRAPLIKRGRTGGDFVLSLRENEFVAGVVQFQELVKPAETPEGS